MLTLPENPLPPKPRHLEACNGCGLCCALELCPAGKLAFPDAPAPCPGLLFTKQRTYCKLVIVEQAHPELPPLIQQGLQIGAGCTMKDEDVF